MQGALQFPRVAKRFFGRHGPPRAALRSTQPKLRLGEMRTPGRRERDALPPCAGIRHAPQRAAGELGAKVAALVRRAAPHPSNGLPSAAPLSPEPNAPVREGIHPNLHPCPGPADQGGWPAGDRRPGTAERTQPSGFLSGSARSSS